MDAGEPGPLVPETVPTETLQQRLTRAASSAAEGVKAAGRKQIYWTAPVEDNTGFGAEARTWVMVLQKYLKEGLHYVNLAGGRNEEMIAGLPESARSVLEATKADGPDQQASIVVCHLAPDFWGGACAPTARDRDVRIGRTMFETDSFPRHWMDHLAGMDEIWVPAHFFVETFARAGVNRSKLHVLPEAVDTEDEFNPALVSSPYRLPTDMVGEPGPTAVEQELATAGLLQYVAEGGSNDTPKGEGPFKFLSIFKWHKRKGVDALLRAYCEEYSKADNVVLYLKTNIYLNPNIENEMTDIFRGIANGTKVDDLPKIILIKDWIAQSELPSLYAAADAFVLPSRGEGWGLPQSEAMAMGLPTITTNFAGTTEFINEDVALPLRWSEMELTRDDMNDMWPGADLPGHHYAEPDVQHLRELMRWTSDHPDEAKRLGKRARNHMRKKYSTDAVASILLEHLQRAQSSKPDGAASSDPPPVEAIQEAPARARCRVEGVVCDTAVHELVCTERCGCAWKGGLCVGERDDMQSLMSIDAQIVGGVPSGTRLPLREHSIDITDNHESQYYA